ncbi:hypothetical protein ACRAWG_16450 [Methylobacterium sp. P31]
MGSQSEEPPSGETLLVAIDDTDNLESPGTGFHARQLAKLLMAQLDAAVLDVTRHQLLFDRRIPYTSHNSSLCLRVQMKSGTGSHVIRASRDYILEHSADGSDAGLCVVEWSSVPAQVEDFGQRAKRDILTLDEAQQLAQTFNIVLEGLTGNHGGKIGALAAVGLRRGGRDGRLAWAPGLRETTGIVTVSDLLARTRIDEVRPLDGYRPIGPEDRIDVRPWPRAILDNGKAVLLVQKAGSIHDHFDWQLASKDIIRRY